MRLLCYVSIIINDLRSSHPRQAALEQETQPRGFHIEQSQATQHNSSHNAHLYNKSGLISVAVFFALTVQASNRAILIKRKPELCRGLGAALRRGLLAYMASPLSRLPKKLLDTTSDTFLSFLISTSMIGGQVK